MSEPKNVYACIAAVSAEIAQTGIAKDRSNAKQGYKFRGIDDVYNALAPILAKHKLVIIPRILSRECLERQSQSGGALFYVTVEAEFDFVSAVDGSQHTARTFGEAMDSADKATNKAMSAAYKYAAFQAFCIPTEGDNDADAQTHEAAATTATGQTSQQTQQRDGLYVIGAKIAKTGTSDKGPWKLYVLKFSDGREGKTFSTSVYNAGLTANREHRAVDVDIDQKGSIVSMQAVFQQQEELEPEPA